MKTFQTIIVEREKAFVTLTINRESKLNALNQETLHELAQALDMLENDNAVRGIVLTGAGEKAFVAGADIGEFVGLSIEEAKKKAEYGHFHIMDRIQNFPKSIIAAVNGFALGGGLELAMACHIRVASDNAKFGLPEVSLGIIPGYGGTQRLPQLVGRGKALEMIMTGDMIDAAEALQWGLVNRVVPLAELMSACRELLDKIDARSGQAISKAIMAVQAGLEDSQQGQQREIELFGESFGTDDCKEGVQAFLERRKPNF